MKKTIFTSLFLLLATAAQADFSIKALHCGPRGSFLGALASDVAIPDYFPPEQSWVRYFIAEPILGDLSACDQYDPVNLGESCSEHDTCYWTLNANKETCDETLFLGWEQACKERYKDASADSIYCLNACERAVQFMYEALRYDDGSFCPSCTAFAHDQAAAASRASAN